MGTADQLAKPECRNWFALGHALTTELCHGLRPFVKRQTETFYNNVKATLAHFAPCSCVFVPKRKPNQYHDMGSCNWAKILQAHHQCCKPNWKQSDSSKWMDPILGPWEIAKLYLRDLGGNAVASVEDMDVSNVLNLMYWCTHFSVPRHLIKDVRDVRNKKWVHVTSSELNDADKQVAFDTIENLLKDPSLAHEPDAQNALKEIEELKSGSDLHSVEILLAEFKELIRIQNAELASLAEESERSKEQQVELKHGQEMLKEESERSKEQQMELKHGQEMLKEESERSKEEQMELKHGQEILKEESERSKEEQMELKHGQEMLKEESERSKEQQMELNHGQEMLKEESERSKEQQIELKRGQEILKEESERSKEEQMELKHGQEMLKEESERSKEQQMELNHGQEMLKEESERSKEEQMELKRGQEILKEESERSKEEQMELKHGQEMLKEESERSKEQQMELKHGQEMLKKESERSKEQQMELKHGQEMLKKALDDKNPIRFGGYTLLYSTILILGTLVWVLSENVKGVRKKDIAKWLVLLFLFYCCLVLDDSSDKEGE